MRNSPPARAIRRWRILRRGRGDLLAMFRRNPFPLCRVLARMGVMQQNGLGASQRQPIVELQHHVARQQGTGRRLQRQRQEAHASGETKSSIGELPVKPRACALPLNSTTVCANSLLRISLSS